METRALFKVLDYEKEIVTIYTQFDGYPEGLPLGVAKYLANRRLVNGIAPDKYFKVVNGMDDVAAHVVAYLKHLITESYKKFTGENGEGFIAGTIYIMPPGTRGVGEKYIYYIYPDPEYAHLISHLIRLELKLRKENEKARKKGNDAEIENIREAIRDLEKRFLESGWSVFIKAVKVRDGKEMMIFNGTAEEYVKKFEKES